MEWLSSDQLQEEKPMIGKETNNAPIYCSGQV